MEGKEALDQWLQSTRVCVAVRCRPLSDKESVGGAAVQIVSDQELLLRHKNEDVPFAFDHVFGPEARQEDLFQTLGLPQLDRAFGGYNSTIFAYGQTGSGKTHTMMNSRAGRPDVGLIPRMSEGLFKRIAEVTDKHVTRQFLVQCSFLEIYNEVIYDLLAPRPKDQKGGGLEVKEQKSIGVYVKDLMESVVEDPATLARLIEEGMANRATAATKMNDASSRSHCVFTIRLHQKDSFDSNYNTISKVNLVDLAGSERAKDTGAEGAMLREGANINKSLSALGNVINALSSMAESGKKRAFIPYRDSKLTRVLQESLGGNSFCTMLAAVSSARSNVEETLSTLNYAKRAKVIRVVAKRNEEMVQVQQLEQEEEVLRQRMALESKESSREASELDERRRQELEALQAFKRQRNWEEKQRRSAEQEAQRQLAKEAARQQLEHLRSKRRQRLQALREQGDLERTLQAVAAIGGRLCVGWPDKIREALKLWQKLQTQFRAVAVYREAAAADLSALWDLCAHAAPGSGVADSDVAPAMTLLGQARLKLESMSAELNVLSALEAQVRGQLGQLAPEVAVALADARTEARDVEVIPEEARSLDDVAKGELLDLLVLVQWQLYRHGDEAYSCMAAEAQGFSLEADLCKLVQVLGDLGQASDGRGAALRAEVLALAGEPWAQATRAAGEPGGQAGVTPQDSMPLPLGLSTFAVPDECLAASSQAVAARHARLLRSSGYGGWSPSADSPEEYLALDLGGQATVLGLSLQGREPCTGHWAQTPQLLRLATSGQDYAFLTVADRTFARPPVRLVHEVAVALVHSRGCFGGEQKWEIRSELLNHADMSREDKLEFFDELIKRTNFAWERDVAGAEGITARVTSSDVLGGKNCEETNKLLQMLSYLCLRLQTGEDGSNSGGLHDAARQWVTKWKLAYFTETEGWQWCTTAGGGVAGDREPLVLEGNCDAKAAKFVSLPRPVMASKLRVHPVSWHRHIGLRCEVHVAKAEHRCNGRQGSASEHLKGCVQLATKAAHELRRCLEERHRALSQDEDDLRQQASDLERQVQEALNRAEASEARAVAAEAALLHARADNERLGATVKRLEADVATASEVRAAAESRFVERDLDWQELHSAIAELTEQLLVMTDARDVLRAHDEELDELLASKDEELQRALEDKELAAEAADLLANDMGRLVEYQRECGLLRQEVSRLEEANKSLIAERDKLARKKEKLEAKKADLQDKLQKSEQYRVQARERMVLLQQRFLGEDAGIQLKVPGDMGEAFLSPLSDRGRSDGHSAHSGGKDSARSTGGFSTALADAKTTAGSDSFPAVHSPRFGGSLDSTGLASTPSKRSKSLQRDTSAPQFRSVTMRGKPEPHQWK